MAIRKRMEEEKERMDTHFHSGKEREGTHTLTSFFAILQRGSGKDAAQGRT
jgi:hypothetical protein